ncbi:metal ABC transporter solute-binding protein, Zn/Mn family [Alicyclobacillus tolerans]|uniref:Zinc/manganese transport system substrate-binding protein n=1 Tax=Alicyclobacillus tolerans TaxID=90970 RepID=A0ABT9LYD1_9BACL|nr:zinc ABC transporter substrate-binding protein [Alicyclobacillus tengchongensis]MDP9729260.1 zinc/manganese transport system substrate-binding protein [Alicyclobacillus tengchongensis]
MKIQSIMKSKRHGFFISSVLLGSVLVLSGCGTQSPSTSSSSAHGSATSPTQQTITAVGAENEYANVISEIGGRYVSVTAIMSNPNTDPHTFEASPQVAAEIANAQLIVQNGLGYDSFMNKLESASPNANRKVIEVQNLLGLPNQTPNPHLWYNPSTMPRVAAAIAADLEQLMPAHKKYFEDNVKKFDASLQPWYNAIKQLKIKYAGSPVAVTEPVADYMLQATGMDIRTPWSLQAAIMNGTDPAPQDVQTEQNLLKYHQVKVFLYNQQVVDPLTQSLLTLAEQHHVPVVGVYETMPPGYSYASWMLKEVKDLQKALVYHQSTQTLS